MTNIKKLFLCDNFILPLIIINALVIFVQEFKGVPAWIGYMDNIFTLLFVVELVIKIRSYGFRNYWMNNWNRMDFILVTISLLSLVQFASGSQMIPLNFLLTLRVFRVFKSFRLIRFVPNVKEIISGVQRAIKASYVVIIAFFILLFIFSILTCSIFKDVAPEYFDTPFNSLYNIFRIFSIEGWYEIPDLIAERSTLWNAFFTKIYFVLLLFGGGILGMSIINSIFVDAMVSDNNDELNEKVEELGRKIDLLSKQLENKN
ncbi:MAG: ion transporter [Rikenellaceae bacterium]|nr:ion transporter [Rikenellaceae bacterium]